MKRTESVLALCDGSSFVNIPGDSFDMSGTQ